MSFFKKKRYSDKKNNSALLTAKAPFALAESYKRLRTNVQFATINGKLKKVMIASALPAETKSSTSINLAIALAETSARVVLVDCDLRQSGIFRYLEMKREEKEPGVSNVVSGGAKLKDALHYVEELNIWVVPTGTTPPNPAELLNSPEMGELLDELAEQFDYIICDTAPINVVSDAINLSRWCDGVVMVVRQNYTMKDEIRRAKEALEAVGANILGVVLARYSEKKNHSSYSYGRYHPYSYRYGYRYKSYYGYGYGDQGKQDKK